MCQGASVWQLVSGHVQVLNVYAAHHDARNEFLTEVFQSVQTLGHNSWVLLGDLNDPPTVSPLALGLEASGCTICVPPVGVASRWAGHRVIDYAITNCLCQSKDLDMFEEKWSDHKGYRLQITTEELQGARDRWEMRPTNRYTPKDASKLSVWTERLVDAWRSHRPQWLQWVQQIEPTMQAAWVHDNVDVRQKHVDGIWFQLNQHLEGVLKVQATAAQTAGREMNFHQKPQRVKGSVPELRKAPRVAHRPYADGTSNTVRVWLRLSSRLAELERQERNGFRITSEHNLRKRLQRCPHYHAGMTASDAERKVADLVRQSHLTDFERTIKTFFVGSGLTPLVRALTSMMMNWVVKILPVLTPRWRC